MKQQILNHILTNTNRERMDDLSTKQVAEKFNISTSSAYSILNDLASEKQITKLEPINGNKFECCGWINNA